jgi:hypothetical protein
MRERRSGARSGPPGEREPDTRPFHRTGRIGLWLEVEAPVYLEHAGRKA